MEMKLGSRSGSQKGLVYSQRDRFRERPGPMLLKPLPGSNPDSAPVSKYTEYPFTQLDLYAAVNHNHHSLRGESKSDLVCGAFSGMKILSTLLWL